MHKRIALLKAVIFFVLWLALLYAGADHPPLPGFVAVVPRGSQRSNARSISHNGGQAPSVVFEMTVPRRSRARIMLDLNDTPASPPEM